MSVSNRISEISESDISRILLSGLRTILRERITRFALFGLLFVLMVGIFGPMLAPYEYNAQQYDGNGRLEQLEPPSADHYLGTNRNGQDVLSRLLYGARYTVITGFLAGSIMLLIGVFVGVTAGYIGGRTDNLLMRFTDFIYGVPFIPFAIVLVTFFGTGFFTTIGVIGLVLWRFIARVLRSQVLQIRERPYIMAAQTSGASTSWIIRKHIIPNIANMAALFFALGVGLAIIEQAGLAFLGVTNPFLPSWGIMIRNANNAGYVTEAWWWSFPPGIMISITVVSLYLLGRGYEQATGDEGAVV